MIIFLKKCLTQSLKTLITLDFRYSWLQKKTPKTPKNKIITKAKTTKVKTSKTTKSKTKSSKSKSKKVKEESFDGMGIVIVDDDIEIDQEKINEERRAYLEEARSQEASD